MKKRRLKRWVKILMSVVLEIVLYNVARSGLQGEIANIIVWTVLFMNPIFMLAGDDSEYEFK